MTLRVGVRDKKDKQIELKKHINAIHCTNNLTLVQRKLINALLFNAYPGLLHKPRFQISARDLCKLIGYNSNDYGKLKKALFGLITIAIEWNVIDCLTGKETQWKASSILSAAELTNGLCTYEYSHIMRELLFQPEIYGKIDINIMAKFKSSYGLALYENCIRYQGLPQTPWFSLEVFRKLMGVFGDKYSAFKDFKKRVLSIAVNEVNSLSQISVLPEIEKQNQKVIRVRFKLSKNKQKNTIDYVDVETEQILKETFGLSVPLIAELRNEYELPYIREKIDMILLSDSFVEGKIRGVAGYLIDSLRKDYKASKTSKTLLNEQRMKKENDKKAKQDKEEEHRIRYEKYVRDKISKYFISLTSSEKDILIADFEAELKSNNKLCHSWYKKDNFEHPAVKACFNDFIKKHRNQGIGEVLSFDDFTSLIDEYS